MGKLPTSWRIIRTGRNEIRIKNGHFWVRVDEKSSDLSPLDSLYVVGDVNGMSDHEIYIAAEDVLKKNVNYVRLPD